MVSIDVHSARLQFRRHTMRATDILCPHACCEAVLRVIGNADGISLGVSKGIITATGPKISSRTIFISAVTLVKMVGLMYRPCSNPSPVARSPRQTRCPLLTCAFEEAENRCAEMTGHIRRNTHLALNESNIVR